MTTASLLSSKCSRLKCWSVEEQRAKSQTEDDDIDEPRIFAERVGHGDGVLAGVFALSDRDVNLSLFLIALLLNLQH